MFFRYIIRRTRSAVIVFLSCIGAGLAAHAQTLPYECPPQNDFEPLIIMRPGGKFHAVIPLDADETRRPMSRNTPPYSNRNNHYGYLPRQCNPYGSREQGYRKQYQRYRW